MLKVVTIFWRDIPSQVTVQEGRKRSKTLLPARFQEAIDRAAMRAKKIDSDAYLEDWDRKNTRAEGNADDVLAKVVADIEADFDDDRLDTIVRNKGIDPEKTTD